MPDQLLARLSLLLLFVVFVAHRAYYTRKHAQLNQTAAFKPEPSRAERFGGLLALLGLIAVALYIVNPEWMAWAAVPMPTWMRLLGVGIALMGFTLLQWSQTTLGEDWSDDPWIREEHRLITAGPYQWIRHPIYTAFLIIMASTFFISANWFIGGIWFGMTAIDVASRVRTEEKMLKTEFGNQYLEYERRTGRLTPRLVTPREV